MSGLVNLARKEADAFDRRANNVAVDEAAQDVASAVLLRELATEIDRHPAEIEQAFRDGLTYATNCVVTDPDEAWRTSKARARLHTQESVQSRRTFVVPDGYEAVRDAEGRATGEIRLHTEESKTGNQFDDYEVTILNPGAPNGVDI